MTVEHIDFSNEFILLVDDDETIRDPLAEMLSNLGLKVDSVGSGKEGLKELKKKQYSFLITDISMPEMDGLELIRHTKTACPKLSSIAMTGFSKKYSYIDVINAGATDFINKPFSIEELEAKLRRAIIERNIKDEFERLSITDSLTGLYNQRYFYARLQDEIIRSQRRRHKLSLILLDLDKFKMFNDNFGHLAGDEILRKAGRIINSCIREGVDSGYRYGGDEFTIILIDANMDIVEDICERIKKAIQKNCTITATIGSANFSKGMTPQELVAKADKQLYKLKAARRK